LKKESSMPAAMIIDPVLASPYRAAATADPTRNTPSVSLRPHFSMSQAAAAYPGSWASVITSVNWKDLTIVNPCSTRRLGIHTNAP